MVSLAIGGFYGIGAYTSAAMSIYAGAPFLIALFCGIAITAVVATAISRLLVRMHGDYFAIATFGLQMVLFSIFNSWLVLTRGPLGMSGIPRPSLFGWVVESQIEFAGLTVVCAIAVFILLRRLTKSSYGRVLRAIREDEVLTASFGKNVLQVKAAAFAVSAACSAVAGVLYAHYISYIDPTMFTINESILVITMVIVGGAASPWGSIVGAAVIVLVPECLRFLNLPASSAAYLRQMIFGSFLLIAVMMRPRGLVGSYEIGRARSG